MKNKSKSSHNNRLNNDTEALISQKRATILIVDDEEALIQMTQKMLNKSNYNTISAESGESAIEIYTERKNEIDLILLDLGMPGMGGKNCLKKLVKFDTEVKIIVTSGYADESLIEEISNDGAISFVLKPYTLIEISEAIRSVLNIKEK